MSIDLATHFPASTFEVINSDKIQVYQGLDITTNKIPLHDRLGVPHHLLGELDPLDGGSPPPSFDASQVKQCPRRFQVVAKGCGWEELIMVSESDTVEDVKKMVESFAQVESERMVLFRGGDDMVRLEDEGKPFVFYDVVEKSTIWVLGLAMKLTIKMPQSEDVLSRSAYGVKTLRGIICELGLVIRPGSFYQ